MVVELRQGRFLLLAGAVVQASPRFQLQRIVQPREALEDRGEVFNELRAGASDAAAPAAAAAGVVSAPVNLIVARASLADTQDDFYTLTLDIGTPPKPCRLILDTGSSDIWVDESKVTGLSNSTTVVDEDIQVELRYGKGDVAAAAFTDRVCLPGERMKTGSNKSLCVAKQEYFVANKVKDFPPARTFDGMLGLGFPAYKSGPGMTFLEDVMQSRFAAHLAFGISMAPANSFVTFGDLTEVMAEAPKGSEASAVTLSLYGDETEDPLTGALSTRPLRGEVDRDRATQWMLAMSIATGVGKYYKEVRNLNVVVDSGVSMMVIPDSGGQYHNTILEMIHPNYQYHLIDGESLQNAMVNESMFRSMVKRLSGFRCTTRQYRENPVCMCTYALQPLTFIFQGEDGKTLNISLGKKDLMTKIGNIPELNQDICRLNILGGPTDQTWILGDVFLRRAYVVHDVQQLKVTLFPIPGTASKSTAENLPGNLRVGAASFVTLLVAVPAAVVLYRRYRQSAGRVSGGHASEDSDTLYNRIPA